MLNTDCRDGTKVVVVTRVRAYNLPAHLYYPLKFKITFFTAFILHERAVRQHKTIQNTLF